MSGMLAMLLEGCTVRECGMVTVAALMKHDELKARKVVWEFLMGLFRGLRPSGCCVSSSD